MDEIQVALTQNKLNDEIWVQINFYSLRMDQNSLLKCIAAKVQVLCKERHWELSCIRRALCFIQMAFSLAQEKSMRQRQGL